MQGGALLSILYNVEAGINNHEQYTYEEKSQKTSHVMRDANANI